MSNELQVYRELGREPATALAFVKEVGASLRGGLKGCTTPGASTAAALTMLTEGLTPPQFEAKYHVMDGGGLALSSVWMHAEMERLGYRPEWIDDGEDGQKATLQITKDGKQHRVTFTLEMAKAKGIVKPKSTWAVDSPLMLRARAIGRCVDMHCPSIRAGVTEECDGWAESPEMAAPKRERPAKAKQPASPVAGEPAAEDATFEPAPVSAADKGELISDAEVEEIRTLAGRLPRLCETAKTVITQIWKIQTPIHELSVSQGRHLLIHLYMDALEIPGDKISSALAKMGVGEVEQLTPEQAGTMLGALRKKWIESGN